MSRALVRPKCETTQGWVPDCQTTRITWINQIASQTRRGHYSNCMLKALLVSKYIPYALVSF